LGVLAVVFLGGAGCERCSKNGGVTPDGTASTSASSAPPIVVAQPDGATVIEAAVITEALAASVAGPAPTTKMSGMGNPYAVECKSPGQAMSPTIFGVAFAESDKDLGATAHRWGGNTTTRYNPKLSGVWSSGSDWFFENQKDDSAEDFLAKAMKQGGRAAITVPIMGWVAKDTTSCSFPTSKFGAQDKTDDKRGCGNGKKPDGKTLLTADPNLTSVKVTPEDVGAWVTRLKARGGVYEYILDNEPGLWNTTHRDVHPEPMTYDELLEKTKAFASAIRKADPNAQIAGPASYGWWEYFYSTKDHDEGFRSKPDRKAHGDVPLLEWYLQQLAAEEKKTGVRLLDVLDVHLYPQAEGVQGPDGHGGDGGGETDRPHNDLRFRTTRSLWDRNYVDESWIKEAVYLLPRMKDIIARNYPGRGLQIGEYNFGAEAHIAGGIALAEALGRFAQYGVTSAFYWNWPKKPSPAYWAFRAYRNYDGLGGHFLDRIVPTSAPSGASLYASKTADGKKWVLIALNFSADRPESASIDLRGCTPPSAVKSFVYTGGDQGFVAGDAKAAGTKIESKLPPYSITVIEVTE
jgi:hypothetical protein